MRDSVVLTVIGADRTGLVEALAERVSAVGGNWEGCRMAHLAGQFAGMLLVTIDEGKTDALVAALRTLDGAGLQVTAQRAGRGAVSGDGRMMTLKLTGDDRVGIVRDVAKTLAGLGVNVEELESEVVSAPMSGEPLFSAQAVLWVPAQVALSDLRTGLESIGRELMVDLISE